MARDKISKKKRSHIMSCIRSKNTKVEVKLRKALWKKGYRYRIHKKLPGSPDIVFVSKKLVVFVDGDFWHGYEFDKLKPKLKNEFWFKKITRNMQRDKEVNQKLKEMDWNVLRFWEHEINGNLTRCIRKIETEIR